MTNLEKIYFLLSEFSSSEKKQFLLSLDQGTIYCNVFDYLSKSNAIPTPIQIFSYLYPNEAFNDVRIRKSIERSKKIITQYLSLNHLSVEKKTKTLIENLELKRSYEWQEKEINQFVENIKPYFDSSSLQIAELDAKLKSQTIYRQGQRTLEPRLQEAMDAMDENYIVQKLKVACTAVTFSTMNDKEYDYGILTWIESNLADKISIHKPLSYLFYHSYLIVKHSEDESFHLVFDYIQENEIVKNEDFQTILNIVSNYCVQKINKGQRDYIQKLFQIYQIEISSQNIYNDLNQLDHNNFKNIVTLSLNLKEYEWTRVFIESQKSRLPKLNREEHIQFAMARYYYELGKYDECVNLILQSKPQDLLNNLSMRVLLCKAYYELDEYDQVDNAIQNAKIYLLRHRSKAYQLALYQNFFKFLSKMIHFTYSKKKAEELKALFESINPVAEKVWLKGKMEDFIK